jgi:hypothetical protein
VVATPEKKVKMAIKSWLSAKGYYFFFPVAGPFAVHGVPDILVCAEGRFIGIECKAPGKSNNTTHNQDDHIHRINSAGGIAFVASSLEDVVAKFTTLGLH